MGEFCLVLNAPYFIPKTSRVEGLLTMDLPFQVSFHLQFDKCHYPLFPLRFMDQARILNSC